MKTPVDVNSGDAVVLAAGKVAVRAGLAIEASPPVPPDSYHVPLSEALGDCTRTRFHHLIRIRVDVKLTPKNSQDAKKHANSRGRAG